MGLLLLLAGCKDAAGPEQPMSGRQTYEQQCARCHGVDGRPTKASPTARDLTNRSYVESLGDMQIRAAIMQGRPAMVAPGQEKMMPAFGNQFSEPELNLLVGYVRSLSNPELGPEGLTPEAVRARPPEPAAAPGE
ncbi:hypothetical protein DB30_01751 [Enhygromyxa salina]|uniref:Cytochrome c domain-containing protein n=1 Tax=Enhygromyxa salina TaxID=215803 RepID=A0A0C2CRK9_9BACT|nr:hypothetical protein DB30_01751 [Enhygromyxa salina]